MTKQLTILITGATAGIGRHAALHLAKLGHRVFATGRRQEALDALAREAGDLPIETLRLDVTDDTAIAGAKAEVDARTGGRGLDALVNNAGYGEMGPLETVSDARLRRQYDTNVFGLMAVTRAFLPAMRRRGAGRVVNVSSIGGRITFPLMGAYNSTKYAVESLSDALRVEMAPFGVGVVVVEPGAIKSRFSSTAMSTLDRDTLAGTPYAPLADHAAEVQSQFTAMEVGPEVISRAIEQAITARRPRARYVAPLSARLSLPLVRLLPTRLLDWIFARFTGLTRTRLLAAKPSPSAPQAA